MSVNRCEQCRLRAKYDRNPKSVLGRLWRWHIGWCPGWRGYFRSLNEEQKEALRQQYGIGKS